MLRNVSTYTNPAARNGRIGDTRIEAITIPIAIAIRNDSTVRDRVVREPLPEEVAVVADAHE